MQAEERPVLAGKYRLVSLLRAGGMGQVWLAEHLNLNCSVAIKLLDDELLSAPEAISRFMREARAAAQLRSPHIVQIIDVGSDCGKPFIAMELLEGETLADRLARVRKLSPRETARILTQVARGVARAHAAGVIHRDLKPSNIFLVKNDDEEIAKVVDFGIAKAVNPLDGDSGATRTGALLGSPHYMSPEQAEGIKIDHRTDIWSLGVMAFECMTGVRPFDEPTLGSQLLAICTRPIPSPSMAGPVPKGFDAWFAKACSRVVDERFSTVQEAAQALRTVCGFDVRESASWPPSESRQELSSSRPIPRVAARPSGPAERVRWPAQRLGVALVVMVLLVLATLAVRQGQSETAHPQPPPVPTQVQAPQPAAQALKPVQEVVAPAALAPAAEPADAAVKRTLTAPYKQPAVPAKRVRPQDVVLVPSDFKNNPY